VHGYLCELDLEIEQIDIKTAFLNGELKEEIHMQQPPGCLAWLALQAFL
jgi:hypothetical protein